MSNDYFRYRSILMLLCFIVTPFRGLADEVSFIKIKKEIIEFQKTVGYVPTEEDYFRLIDKDGLSLSVREQGMLWIELINLQHAPFNLKDILAIQEAKRQSIKNFKCEFRQKYHNLKDNNDLFNGESVFIYVVQYPCFFVDKCFTGIDGKREHQQFCFNGQNMINIVNPLSDLPNARISDITTRTIGFCPSSPFAQMMLFDTKKFDAEHAGFDFSLFFSRFSAMVVFEKKEYFDGSECIVVAGQGHRFLFDPRRDFSLVKFISYFHHYENTSEGPKITKRTLLSTRTLFDLSHFGNGIWLPSKAESQFYTPNGEMYANKIIHYTNVEINKKLPDNFFDDIVPANSIVFDSIRNMTYMQSDNPSINRLLKETAKSKRVFIYRYISVTAGLLMIIIALLLKYRAYLKDKRERENKAEEETK